MSDLEQAGQRLRQRMVSSLAVNEIRERARSRRRSRYLMIGTGLGLAGLIGGGIAIASTRQDPQPKVATATREKPKETDEPKTATGSTDVRVALLVQPNTVSDEDVVFITTPIGAPRCLADNALVVVTGPSNFRYESPVSVLAHSGPFEEESSVVKGAWRLRLHANEFPAAGQYSIEATCEGGIDYEGVFTRLQSGEGRPIVDLVVADVVGDPGWLSIEPPLTGPPCLGGSGTLTIVGPLASNPVNMNDTFSTSAEPVPGSRPQEHGYWSYVVEKQTLAGPGRYSISATCTGSENGTIQYTGEFTV